MSRQWNFFTPHAEGKVMRQARTRPPHGIWERQLGRNGFFGAATEFYHPNPPTAWVDVDDLLRPRLLDTSTTDTVSESPWDAVDLLHNADLRFRFWRPAGAMSHLVRNADGDDLMFIHRGGGEFYCDFGHLTLEEGDYLVIPRGTMWRIEPLASSELLLIESTNSEYSLGDMQILGRHAPFDPGMFDVPSLDTAFKNQLRTGNWTVQVKVRNEVGCLTYPYNPLDAQGWKGDLYPVRLNVRDIRPIMSHRMHLPPTTATTFVSDRFVVCTFVPRPGETDPTASKLPLFHDNVDYDEVMFMHAGSKTHRTKLFRPGAMTFHPRGVVHGPHPEALSMARSDEPIPLESTYIMLDARNRLDLGAGGLECDVPEYGASWRDSIEYAPDALATAR